MNNNSKYENLISNYIDINIYNDVYINIKRYINGINIKSKESFVVAMEYILNNSSIRLPGTIGIKFNKNKANEIINNAINNNTEIGATKIPDFKLNAIFENERGDLNK